MSTTTPSDEPEDELLPGDDTPDRPGLEKTKPASVSEAHLKSVLESLVFVSDKPVQAKRLARVARAKTADVSRLLGEVARDYEGRGIELVEVGGGWQFRSAVANAPFVREIVAQRPVRLTRAQLETLAIAAYRQPLTRPELDEIRGVDSGSALKILLERELLKILGRKDEPGRPLLYGTTPYFLEFFGLGTLDQLPTLKEFTELSDESRALFARKTGEDIESIGDIDVPESSWEEEEESEAEASEQHLGEGDAAVAQDTPPEPSEDEDEDDEDEPLEAGEDDDDDEDDDEDEDDEDDDDDDEE